MLYMKAYSLMLMKKRLVLIVPVAVFLFNMSFAHSAGAASISERELFERFTNNVSKTRPKSFSCRITGDVIVNSLARIPPDARTSQALPEVYTYFERERGQVIRVSHVDELFRNMFSSYQPYFAMTGAWIEARGGDWVAFSRGCDMKITGENALEFIVKITRHSEDGSSYAVFRFAKTGYTVRSVQFYNANRLVYSVANEYSTVGQYTLPSAMTITSYREERVQSSSRLVFSGYSVNIPIPAEVFQR
jgi:hypothetical protein